MNDKNKGRHTVTRDYLDGLEAQRRTTPDADLTLEMGGGTGQAARDAAQRDLERQIGRTEDRLYNETPEMTPEFENMADLIKDSISGANYDLPMVEGECNNPECWIENMAEGAARHGEQTKEESAAHIREAFQTKHSLSAEDYQQEYNPPPTLDSYEPAAVPDTEIEPPEAPPSLESYEQAPEPQIDIPDMLNEVEQTAAPDNDVAQQNGTIEKSTDSGIEY